MQASSTASLGTLAVWGGAMVGCALVAIACLVLAPARGNLVLAVLLGLHLIGFAATDYHARNSSARSP